MHLTLNTDASWWEGDGGYAFYIRYGRGKWLIYGKLNQSRNCLDAELMAIANGLVYILLKINGPISKIIVNTDSVPAITYITGMGRKKNYQHILGSIHKSIGKLGCDIEWRHVKAHSGNGDNRSLANNLVDNYAKIGRKLEK